MGLAIFLIGLLVVMYLVDWILWEVMKQCG